MFDDCGVTGRDSFIIARSLNKDGAPTPYLPSWLQARCDRGDMLKMLFAIAKDDSHSLPDAAAATVSHLPEEESIFPD